MLIWQSRPLNAAYLGCLLPSVIASHWQPLSRDALSSTPHNILNSCVHNGPATLSNSVAAAADSLVALRMPDQSRHCLRRRIACVHCKFLIIHSATQCCISRVCSVLAHRGNTSSYTLLHHKRLVERGANVDLCTCCNEHTSTKSSL